jgi:hypothetical protein
MDWPQIAALFTPQDSAESVQARHDARVAAIQKRLVVIADDLGPAFLPGRSLIALLNERDALWLELARMGEWPWLVRPTRRGA